MTLLLRNGRALDGSTLEVRIAGETIEHVAPRIDVTAEDDVHDLDGQLLLPALAEPHAHLDKAFLAERIVNPTGDLLGAINALNAHRHLITLDDTVERAVRAVELMVRNGTTAIRTHVDVTRGNGLMSVEALQAVRARVGHLADLQVVALVGSPVCGRAGQQQVALLRAALDTGGVDLVGGCPHLEDDVAGATAVLLAIAADYLVGVDLHTDETLDPHKLGLLDLAEQVLSSGFPHPVAASHCVSLGMLGADAQRRIAARVAEAGISVIANPDTNLYLQARGRPTATPRGLTAVQALIDAGVNVAAGSDNLQDLFNPLGKGDPLDAAGLMVLAGHLLPAAAFDAVSNHSRRAMGLLPAGPEAGAAAELISVPATTVRETLAFTPPRGLVVHRGRVLSGLPATDDRRPHPV